MVSFENNPSFKFSKEAIPEYQDIWTLNNDPYKEAIRKLRLENILEENPVLSFEQPISSKYNFVMRQTDYIKVAIPEIQNISIINQNLLDIVFTPSENVNSIDLYIFNVGQIVEDYQYKDVHAKVTLKVGSG